MPENAQRTAPFEDGFATSGVTKMVKSATVLNAYLFSPAELMASFRTELRKKRRTPVQPSQQNRKKKKPKRLPQQSYTVGSYGRAIAKACARAEIPHWHPHQLRHNRATELRREYGLDTARVVLGHRSPQITEVYAELDTNKAIEVMARLG